MNRFSFKELSLAVAAAVTLVSGSAAFAEDTNVGLQKFLDAPTSFVAISEGAPGPVTYASMVGDTLLVHFEIPTHSGDMFGEVVGEVNADGEFNGNGILIDENGAGRAAAVSMTFQEDGMIVASIDGGLQASGFMPRDAFYGY